MLAYEYGWAKKEILENVYLDELVVLTKLINTRKIQAYKTQLAIAQNPHVKNPRELWDLLDRQERQIDGRSIIDDEFDAVGFEAFKQTLQKHSKSMQIKEVKKNNE